MTARREAIKKRQSILMPFTEKYYRHYVSDVRKVKDYEENKLIKRFTTHWSKKAKRKNIILGTREYLNGIGAETAKRELRIKNLEEELNTINRIAS